jgi:hypothetical protein
VSNVAPPHISSENSSGAVVREASAITASMSYVRMRVASSDWWASRIVVSVHSSGFCSLHPLGEARAQFQSRSRVPLRRRPTRDRRRHHRPARAASPGGALHDRLPLTMTSPM